MKALGAVLVMGACVLLGFGWTGTVRRKIQALGALCDALRRAETDLRQQNRPLAEMMEQEGLSDLAQRLRAGMLFSQAAEPLLRKLEHLFGAGEVTAAVRELAWSLGRYDCGTQAEACRRACSRLEGCKTQLERELSEKQKLYHAVPVALGCIVLLAMM